MPAPNGTIGQAMRGRDLHDRGDFVGRVREADDVGGGGGVVRLAVAVVFADGGGVVRARAEQLLELGDGGIDGAARDEVGIADQYR